MEKSLDFCSVPDLYFNMASLKNRPATFEEFKGWMIMGHTIQEAGINAAYNDRTVGIYVGMSKIAQ
ncbi:unnamed protein product [Dovyalis caffra]|uniref:Uncharacterized protein n=1 Tax=Dovyalis caffra TaxID=77055 RepID=A0AAV1QNR7_9ROSI|nr:unnamed protein product [Dovyalis caffra]